MRLGIGKFAMISVGRVGHDKPGVSGVYVGRPTALGNPFKIGVDGDRDEVIRKYEEWFTRLVSIAAPNPVKNAVEEIRKKAERGDVVLMCHCAPSACHADVIKAYLEPFTFTKEDR